MQAVALVLGLMVVLALSLSAYYAYKTRSKIWHHGKANIYWDEPLLRPPEGHDVQDWVSRVFVSSIIYFVLWYLGNLCWSCLSGKSK